MYVCKMKNAVEMELREGGFGKPKKKDNPSQLRACVHQFFLITVDLRTQRTVVTSMLLSQYSKVLQGILGITVSMSFEMWQQLRWLNTALVVSYLILLHCCGTLAFVMFFFFLILSCISQLSKAAIYINCCTAC